MAIVGAGAGGLIAASILRRTGQYKIVVYESSNSVGGVWKYTKSIGELTPMYNSLRCNLPKEIMAFSEYFPFPDKLPSYVGHSDVLGYLEDFATKEKLHGLIRFDCKVESVSKDEQSDSWRVMAAGVEEEFDSVLVCNGHYSEPVVPSMNGLGEFTGLQIHSIDYDNPSLEQYINKRVLVVGSRSSGTDMAREISTVATQVYVADRGLPAGKAQVHGNIHHKPAIEAFSTASVRFADDDEVEIDIVLWCTGFASSFPFLAHPVIQRRKVANLYQHLFSIDDPTLAFIGLPYAVAPFPLMELQACWIEAVYSGRSVLPSREDQYKWLNEDEEACRRRFGTADASADSTVSDANDESLAKYHYMGGDLQWTYCRFLAPAANVADLDRRLKYIDTIEQIYAYNSHHKPSYPGAPDTYRQINYKVDPETLAWEVVSKPPSECFK